MALTTGILSLGTRQDATTWELGCKANGLETVSPVIKKPEPSLADMKTWFVGSPNWLFIAGHFSSYLYNEKDTVSVTFLKDGVDLKVGAESAKLRKSDSSFALEKSTKVIVWGGCSVLGDASHIKTIRSLFNNPLMLGFAGLTGWRIVDAMLGNGFIKPPQAFFERLSDSADPSNIRDAWMETAKFGYGGNPEMEPKFRAVDPDGQSWCLKDKKIIKCQP